MELNTSTIAECKIIPIKHEIDVSEARRAAKSMADLLCFDEISREHAALVATELASNLFKHAGSGALLLQSSRSPGRYQLELLSIDNGPGLESVERALTDGYSTNGTLGFGLGAVKRLSSSFDIFSIPGIGTLVWAGISDDVCNKGRHRSQDLTGRSGLSISGISFPKAGEAVCGDNWGYIESADSLLLMVADGLGHGSEAAVASRQAISQLVKHGFVEPAYLMQEVHQSLKCTRGAAVSLILLDKSERTAAYAALGNVNTVLQSRLSRQILLNQDGTAGFQIPRIRTSKYNLPEKGFLIMHTDGISSRWDLNKYPGFFDVQPGLLCGLLFRDYTKGHDDSTVVAIRFG